MMDFWTEPEQTAKLQIVAKVLGKPSKDVFFVDAEGDDDEYELFHKIDDESTSWEDPKLENDLSLVWSKAT